MTSQLDLRLDCPFIDNVNFRARSLASIARVNQQQRIDSFDQRFRITRWTDQATDSAFTDYVTTTQQAIIAVGYKENPYTNGYESLIVKLDYQLKLIRMTTFALLPFSCFNRIEIDDDGNIACYGQCCNPRFDKINVTRVLYDEHLNILSRYVNE